jgi:GWxTD domain-containing protein
LLVVEVINEKNEVIEKKERLIFKQGMNPDIQDLKIENTFASKINNIDTLKKYIRYLYPIENSSESVYSNNQLNYDSLHYMQKYFYQFWKSRDIFNPELAWLQYLQQIKKANKEFSSGFIKGFLSDRGRVFLSHGLPNSRSKENHPQQFKPFEFWHYYKIGNERDVKFIFSETTPNQYRMVYSNKEGEVSDQDWSNKFNQDYYDNNNDNNSPWDYFNNPK